MFVVRLPALCLAAIFFAGCERGPEESFSVQIGEASYSSGVESEEREPSDDHSDEVESLVLDNFEDRYGVTATSAQCPAATGDIGTTSRCEVVAGGIEFELGLSFIPHPEDPSKMRVNWRPIGVEFGRKVEVLVAEDVQTRYSAAAEATCEQEDIWRTTVGERVPCVATLVATGEQIPLSLIIEDDQGNVTLRYNEDG
ncbi:hypothetical protein [Rubrivirga sp.]|uniref:hypothetical protein n=1 Tax=Rubrivirga sp. TaxID=1885344 RepID=UPI003C71C7FC